MFFKNGDLGAFTMWSEKVLLSFCANVSNQRLPPQFLNENVTVPASDSRVRQFAPLRFFSHSNFRMPPAV